jgi:hypothetical protein
MSEILVDCYAGYKGEQFPQRFTLREQVLEVKEVEDQWYSPSSQYFRVRASDGNIYILRHDQEQDSWSLDAFRRTMPPGRPAGRP